MKHTIAELRAMWEAAEDELIPMQRMTPLHERRFYNAAHADFEELLAIAERHFRGTCPAIDRLVELGDMNECDRKCKPDRERGEPR